MSNNHQFIDILVVEIRRAFTTVLPNHKTLDWLNIQNAFKLFSESLLAHIEEEDANCYALVDTKIGGNEIFYSLISDHINIRELIVECQQLIKLQNRTKFLIVFSRLEDLLGEHSIREEKLMNFHSKNLESSTIRIVELLRTFHSDY